MASGAAAGFLLVLALWWRGGGAADTEEVVVGEPDGEVSLRCWNASSQVLAVQWFRGELGEIPMLLSSDGKLPSDSRFSLVGNSSLHISGLRLEDEGHYVCREILAETNHTHRTQLLMAGGPDQMEVSISPTGTLPNGTLYAKRHDVLNFTCSSDTWPDSATKWDFNPLGSAQEPFTEVNSSRSSFVLQNVMPNYQGNYSCLATNLLSQHQKSVIRELLVYCTNRDAGDILELMDSEDEDLYLESTGEPTLHQTEGRGNGCSTRSTESSFPETSISLEEIQRSEPTS
ncbi:V-set and immunoglobulin domain-containing protein 10 [Notechis scutatus]|uniref:V-set and immunoglobulin domain-containing protein 10 n=1 Tax=Notechis scutatus TaxID=8663 RepID=UPI000E77FB19|nr:V-set and immunoglobulin domain-containing protein 10 [Notechis scutatus]